MYINDYKDKLKINYIEDNLNMKNTNLSAKET